MKNDLEINNLTVKYSNKTVLKDINLALNKGEVTILLGLNGAGKTTLLKSMIGLMKRTTGEVIYNNKDILKLSNKERGKLISYIPQNLHTSQNYSVKDVILMGITPYLGMFDMPSKEHHELVKDILKKLNIEYLKDKYISEISGGERRLVYLARIFIQNSNIILLDEPNTFLDYVKQHEFFKFISDLIRKNNLINLITVHDINLALRYADKIVILSSNEIVDVIDCKVNGYEKKFVSLMEKIYNKKLEIAYTKFGPVIVC
ncbi:MULTISPECIES: ABC transporter ATP-binding protein [Clostridium]|uniref:ABC transporter ATP-binding protein n=1 Tax=Clostridium botulinum TaxID=1491 RepID=A0A6B4JP14_CLOBO|nr:MULTISPECIES: ABC transporter ATP-binding protein [Clostridium]EES50944.1 putative iron ABC transporter, ATP-binding protein [Clostridium botulinum E1 str. 'BoNT E Beluga']MBN1037624.1 ABC transporter ATP-binding protein [Clostridium botulinum]MBY6762164.1 ABC transporter ATP-binding protein [Clostridium botulinum]MBY6920523.1 ABC transporter ATP-binding protein [Clostridium botulinum]MCR1131761.1 ABC transporter ATP-binding protein [Clostridium botulinum]